MESSLGSTGPASDRLIALDESQQRAAISKINWRLIPLLFFCYIIAYVDRINVGFAKSHLREVLGVDPLVFNSVYGFGAGLFFIGYFIFELPSNLILQRVGARVWIARIMILWGFVSMTMMFMKSVPMFYTMRFLLGAAEAGFFPGVILYLTYWYPAKERARTVALFALGGVAAGVVGSPISGALLELDGMGGLAGWQWLFLLEAIPAVLMGLVVLLILPNRPHNARWLSDSEKAWVQGRLDAEAARPELEQRHRLSEVFTSGRVWLLCLLYFLMNIGGYGYELWLPSIIKSFSGLGDAAVGFINAIPYGIAAIVMLLVGRHSDKTGERRIHVAVAAMASAIGFGLSAYFKNPFLAMAALALAFAGIKSTLGPFWAMTTAFLSGTAAAGGIALINSVGNLGGFFGPYIVGLIKDKTGSNLAALLFLGTALLCMGLLALAMRTMPKSATRS
ncbi:MAG TPA: MFS transporter [Candidatus Limnocylindria bacterium]|nr:MFS transporter [Candidatus Limnocylindria bacterium]